MAEAASRGPVQPHWLRRNEGSRSPHRVLCIDTETQPQVAGQAEQHTLRWWHARLTRRHVERPRQPVTLDLAGSDTEALADQVDALAIAKHSLWVYTHNLGFDLTVTQLLEKLYARGWEIVDLGITGRSPWVRMNNGRRRIVFCDSGSWMPAPLADIGESIGIAKPVVEDWYNATDEEIAVRCLIDTRILSDAMIGLMDWWDDNDMGRWSWTGPGCGWASFRHRFLAAKVLMDPEPGRIALERQAIYGGRREAYRIGRLGEGNYADLDFESAYPRLASTMLLPRRPIADVPSMPLDHYKALPPDWGVLAEVDVITSEPIVPCRVNGSVLYPVGSFRTVLTSPDIDGALQAGAFIRIGRAIVYQLEAFLSDWGKWACGIIDGTGEIVPPQVRTWVKHISRTVIGRWAMHAQRTEDWGASCHRSFHAEPGTDLQSGCEVIDLHACGRHLRIYRDAEPENVFPAVTAWIEAGCRQLLAQAMAQLPAGSVMQCDTDGFMACWPDGPLGGSAGGQGRTPSGEASDRGRQAQRPVPEQIGPVRVRVKGLYHDAQLFGPQQMVLGDSRRLSGVPKGFTTTDGLTYSGWAWPGYAWQLARSQPGVYTRPHVTVALRGPYGSRWVLENGHTLAPETQIKGGRTILIRPGSKSSRYKSVRLAQLQPNSLTRNAA